MNLRKPSVCVTCMSVLPGKANSRGYAASGACIVCRKFGCDQCSRVFGWTQTWDAGDALSLRKPGFRSVPARVCSASCFNHWASGLVQNGHVLTPAGPYWSLFGMRLEPSFAATVQQMITNIQLQHAKDLGQAGRYEEAARAYEQLKMWREAGEIRSMSRRVVTTQVHVDLNHLIDQMRQGGLTTTYTCPACRSPIKVTGDTRASSLQTCTYCGSSIQATDLADFLTRTVGYR